MEVEMKNAPIVKIEGLRKNYDTKKVLEGLDLEIPAGRIVGLLGSNGCGKTTLLRILAGFMHDYQGEVAIDGMEPGAKTKTMVAYLPDKGGFPEKLTIEQMVDLYELFFDDFDRAKALALIERFGLNLNDTPKQMSKGMAEKAQIALTMSRRARLYLLDEPIGGVDVEARDVVLNEILESFNLESTIIIVTHLIRDIEKLFDDVCVIKNGVVATYENCDELRARFGGSLEDAMKEMLGNEFC